MWCIGWASGMRRLLVNFGITAKSFKPGEEVTVTMRGMAKSGEPIGRVEKVVLPDGEELSMGNER